MIQGHTTGELFSQNPFSDKIKQEKYYWASRNNPTELHGPFPTRKEAIKNAKEDIGRQLSLPDMNPTILTGRADNIFIKMPHISYEYIECIRSLMDTPEGWLDNVSAWQLSILDEKFRETFVKWLGGVKDQPELMAIGEIEMSEV